MPEGRPFHTAASGEPLVQSRRAEICISLAAGAGIGAAAIGAAVLFGWAFDLPISENFQATWVTMKANTALGFLCAGFALWLFAREDGNPIGKAASQVCAVFVVCLGVLNVAQYAFGWDFGIDQLLFTDQKAIANANAFPGRMSPVTAANFSLIGFALLLYWRAAGPWVRIAEALVIPASLSSYLALLGYLYGVKVLYAAFSFTAVALNTAVAFLVLSAGILMARPDRGLMRMVVSEHAGGLMARRLLPLAVIVPTVLGWLRLEGQRIGLYGFEFGTAILIIAVTVFFAAVILWNVKALDDADRERQQLDVIRRLNAELDHRVAELAGVNKELEAFSYSVAHDLRAPLRAIDGFSRILAEEHSAQLSTDAKKLLGIVSRNTQKMGRLIDDLLAFAQLGRQALKTERVQLGDLVRRTVDEMSHQCDGRNVQFCVGDLGIATADPALLRQVFANLLGNAIKFTRNKDPAKVEIGCRDGSGTAEAKVYFVKDNGAGFDTRYSDKLFAVFQRLHRTDEYEGTGIGLATVHRIIERHGGRIWAEAKVDEGATFYFTLKGDRADGRAIAGNPAG